MPSLKVYKKICQNFNFQISSSTNLVMLQMIWNHGVWYCCNKPYDAHGIAKNSCYCSKVVASILKKVQLEIIVTSNNLQTKVVNCWGHNGSSYDMIVNSIIHLYFTCWNFVIGTYFEIIKFSMHRCEYFFALMCKIKRDLGLSSTLYGLLHLDNKILYRI